MYGPLSAENFGGNHVLSLTCRTEGGIPPLVELLDFFDAKVQRAAAAALRTLAFKNDENKNQVNETILLLYNRFHINYIC